ncbi:hypothetical protein DPMN_009613 [Dreissena polymorpha]|uniref:Uncharacterized protein n=1 Tax=Dreissena polymorpha TaxID=45954 RepID=A0A9D4MXA3_DREPO|nr:hypothetical protein DPMN_009613 [Dreissena polymorpha]
MLQGDCRKLVCPEGHLRWNNKCDLPSILVGFTFSVVIKLELFDNGISDDILGSLDNVTERDLTGHGLDEWELEFFKVVNNVTPFGVKYFVARLYKKSEGKTLAQVLLTIRQALDNIWQINYGNISIRFKPSFNDFITIRGEYENRNFISVYKFEIEDVLQVETLILLSDMKRRFQSLIVTKSYFCNQIDLFDDEYEDYQYQVYLTSVNKTLGNGKFRRLKDSDGNNVIRVCHEEFGHEWMYKSKSYRLIPNTGIETAIVFVLIIGTSLYELYS